MCRAYSRINEKTIFDKYFFSPHTEELLAWGWLPPSRRVCLCRRVGGQAQVSQLQWCCAMWWCAWLSTSVSCRIKPSVPLLTALRSALQGAGLWLVYRQPRLCKKIICVCVCVLVGVCVLAYATSKACFSKIYWGPTEPNETRILGRISWNSVLGLSSRLRCELRVFFCCVVNFCSLFLWFLA